MPYAIVPLRDRTDLLMFCVATFSMPLTGELHAAQDRLRLAHTRSLCRGRALRDFDGRHFSNASPVASPLPWPCDVRLESDLVYSQWM
jgi:hypothetical protein